MNSNSTQNFDLELKKNPNYKNINSSSSIYIS